MSNPFDRASALRSALLVTGSTYVTYAVGLLVSIVIARQLGPRDYGHYAYLIWLTGTLNVLVCNGITFCGIRFVSESLGRGNVAEARNVQGLLGRWFNVSVVIVSALFILAYPWVQPAGWDHPAWIFAAATLGAMVFKSGYVFETAVSKGYGRFEVEAYSTILMGFANLAGAVVLAILQASIGAYIALFVVLCIGHSLVANRLMRRAGISPGDGAIAGELLARIKTQFVWTAVFFLFNAFANKSLENLFLNAYVGPEAVAWFAVATAMTRGGIDMLASGLTTVLMSMMSHAYGSKDERRFQRILSDAVRYYYFMGIILAGVGVLWSAPVIHVMYGVRYAEAIFCLQAMILVAAFTMPEGAISSLLTTTDHQSMRVILAVGAVLVALAAAAYLVPRYGLNGAIAAHVLARLCSFFASIAIAVKVLKVVPPYGELLRMTAAGAVGLVLVMLVLWFSTGLLAQFAAGSVFGVGCLAGSLLLRVWTTDDVRILSTLTQHLPQLQGLERWIAGRARDIRAV